LKFGKDMLQLLNQQENILNNIVLLGL